MPITIGIDLGTTNTAVSYMKNGRPVMLQNEKGYTVFPSIVYWASSGDVILGRRARSKMLTNPERGVYAAKRLMGLRHDSEKVEDIQKRIPYRICASSDGMCLVEAAGEKHSPIDIASLILQEAKRIAEYALDEQVTGAVITVPAHFNHAQRDMTKRAAKMAGIHCELIINEPTSAALAYGFRQDSEKKVLVYDLGGGTFDVSLLQFDVGVVETLATRGDTFLGGEDFDTRIVNHIAEQFLAQSGVDLRESMVASLRLKDAAEAAKCELSFKEKTKIYIPQIHEGQSVELMYSRAELEESTEDLIQKTLDVVRQTLEDSKTRISQVDEVLLVGGQSRMPRIQQAISNLFNKKPSRGVNPDEAVAIGAAVRAGSMDDPSKAGPVLLDVTPFDLGIDISGGLFEKVILRNSKVPTSVTKTFSAVRHNQKVIRIVVRQGESRIASENEFLGEFRMSNLSKGAKGTIAVEVTFEIDSSGMLKVRAVEPHTGEEADITVRNYGEFTQGGGVSLSVEERSHEGKASSDVDQLFQDEEDAPQSENKKIQKKVGFFGRLFGANKKKESNRLELGETPEDFSEDEVIPVMDAVPEDISEDDLFLEDIFEEKPAQQGLANSSFAVEGQDLEEAEISIIEGGEEETDVSAFLVSEQSIVEVEDTLDDLLLELEEDSDDVIEQGELEGTLDELLEDLDATIMMERPVQDQSVALPIAKTEEVEEELDLEFLEEIGMENVSTIHEEDNTSIVEEASSEKERTTAQIEDLDLSFLDDGSSVQEDLAPSVEEEVEEELDLGFLDDDVEEIALDIEEEVEDVSPLSLEEEVEEELDLGFLEDDAEEIVLDTEEKVEISSSVEEELDLSFLELQDENEIQNPVSPKEELVEVYGEIDLDLLSAETEKKEEIEEQEVYESDEIDLSIVEESKEEPIHVLNEEKPVEKITLKSQKQESNEQNNIIQSFLAANVEKTDIFSIQNDGFFSEEATPSTVEEVQKDEAVDIPTSESTSEEAIDLDFFEDLFDD